VNGEVAGRRGWMRKACTVLIIGQAQPCVFYWCSIMWSLYNQPCEVQPAGTDWHSARSARVDKNMFLKIKKQTNK